MNRYILIYYTESKYLHFTHEYEKRFKTFDDLRNFFLENIENIMLYSIYKLTDLSNK